MTQTAAQTTTRPANIKQDLKSKLIPNAFTMSFTGITSTDSNVWFCIESKDFYSFLDPGVIFSKNKQKYRTIFKNSWNVVQKCKRWILMALT